MDALKALALLRSELDKEHAETIPEGFLTANAWAAAWGMQRARAGTFLRAGIASGRVEMREFRIKTSASVRRVPHYRVKP